MISAAVMYLLIGGGLLAIGVWGRRNAGELAMSSRQFGPPETKERSLRRGALLTLAAGGLFIAFALFEVVTWIVWMVST